MNLVELSLGVILCLVGSFFLINGIFSGYTINYVLGLILGILVIAFGIMLIKTGARA
jgi:hypothetical protein